MQKLSNVSLANNLKQLSPYMFQGCTALTQISLPNTLARLNGAFEQCSGLTALQFPEDYKILAHFLDAQS